MTRNHAPTGRRAAEPHACQRDGRTEPHRLSPGLRLRADGLLVYDAGQPTWL